MKKPNTHAVFNCYRGKQHLYGVNILTGDMVANLVVESYGYRKPVTIQMANGDQIRIDAEYIRAPKVKTDKKSTSKKLTSGRRVAHKRA